MGDTAQTCTYNGDDDLTVVIIACVNCGYSGSTVGHAAHLKVGDSCANCKGGRYTEWTPRVPTTVSPAIFALMLEIERQDEKHGPYRGTVLGRSRLALATLEDEVLEARAAWRSERWALDWTDTRAEVLQVAAVAIRTLRDAL